MKVKTNELIGRALNWAVEECEYARMQSEGEYVKGWVLDQHKSGVAPTRYSTDWALGGPIIERECIQLNLNHLRPHVRPPGETWIATRIEGSSVSEEPGPTPLIAAMRCYVASQLGDEVEVPDELMAV